MDTLRRVSPCLGIALALVHHPLFAQARTGELRLSVEDPAGLALTVQVELVGPANQVLLQASTNSAGELDFPALPYGFYRVAIRKDGFAPLITSVEIRSAMALQQTLHLSLGSVTSSVDVNETDTLIDPYLPSSVARIGTHEIEDRITSLPGRSIQDLVVTQPGWLYEGNAVLHPRGSEYQTQFVVDGLPLTDNRSPSFGPELEADNVQSLAIYTAGYPAEYGRKLGGVVELNTRDEPFAGPAGEIELSGGSYATAQGFAEYTQAFGRNGLEATASGSRSSHYLNPVVPENYTNNGTTGDFSSRFDRRLGQDDRLSFTFRHELSRFEIPNELVQEQAGQLQTGNNAETFGSINYRHTLSPKTLIALVGFVRDDQNDLNSNANATPILAMQRNDSREGYFKATYSAQLGRQAIKAGIESDATTLREHFAYDITNPTQFDPGTPATSAPFDASRPDLEQAAFVEDLVRLGNYSVSGGLRWDHYQLLLNQNAFSPRVSASRYFPAASLLVHAAYDRIFQTPSSENILLSSSPFAQMLNPVSLGVPVQPSHGNFYEAGLTALMLQHVRTDLNVFRRDATNYADDDQLLNTGVSYPIAFRKAVIYGAEAKLGLLGLGRFSGYASYSYILGNVFAPVTGGLFLGEDAAGALTQLSGHFPDSQDQRNTVRTRLQYQASPRLWIAAGLSYDSGLPFAFDGEESDALAQYGQAVINHVNFDRGRITPSLLQRASFSLKLYEHDALRTRLQVDGTNLSNRLDLIDFGGLFSGNAIGPGRSVHLRLATSF